MIKKYAEMTLTKPNGNRVTVRSDVKGVDIFDEINFAFSDYVDDGDKIESIYFWEEETKNV